MNMHRQLLASIAVDPGNPLPRLMLADWLEEHGSAMAQLWRGELARTMVMISDPSRRGRGDGAGKLHGSLAEGDGIGAGYCGQQDGGGAGRGGKLGRFIAGGDGYGAGSYHEIDFGGDGIGDGLRGGVNIKPGNGGSLPCGAFVVIGGSRD